MRPKLKMHFITNVGDWNSVIKWIDLMLALLKAVPGGIESDQMLDDRIIVQLQKVCKRPDYDNTIFHKKYYIEK